MRFGLLGPLEVRAEDGPLPLGGAKQRALLALLLLNAGRVVARERLIDGLWGEEPPDTSVKLVQLYVSGLRKVLPVGAIVTRAPGYLLQVDPDAVDLGRFESLVAEARKSEPGSAAGLLREALELWRGPALAEFGDESLFRAEGARLEELRLATIEQRIHADLALGRPDELVGELERLVADHPHRERLRGQLMLALYRSGRQAEALAAYGDARAGLHELGLEPGEPLKALERQILTHDPALDLRELRELVADGRTPLPGPLVPEPAFPFVGRAGERETLSALLARAAAGEGGLVLLSGESGGGKTRLIRELAREAVAAGARVLYGVSDAAVTTPYQPLREWLEFLLRTFEPALLGECLGAGARELGRLVPELISLAGEPPVERRDPESERFVLQGAVIELLLRLSVRRPLLIVADDVHWADGETLQLLRRLARNAPEARWLVVAAYRGEETSDEVAQTVGDLGRLEAATRITLGNLSDDEVVEFVRRSTDAEASAELVSALCELSDGTPLLLCELWRDLSERGGIDIGPTARLIHRLADLRGPQRVSELVWQRLSRLDGETVELLELAAVAGPQFELRLLTEAAGTEPAVLADGIEEAVRRGMIEELADPAFVHRFGHELVRRAVYDRLTAVRRAQLHARVAEALEVIHAPDPSRVLPELAHHFTVAAPVLGPERAVAYNLRAAEAAMVSATADLAAGCLARALELGIADPRVRARVQLDLAFVLSETGQRPEARTLLAASLDTATALGAQEIAATARVLTARMDVFNAEAEPEAFRIVAQEAMETFTAVDDERGLSRAWNLIARVEVRRGRSTEALAAHEHALDHAVAAGDQTLRREAIAGIARMLVRGPAPVPDAIRRCEELIGASPGDRALEAVVTRSLAALVAMDARPDEARDLLERSSPILEELGQASLSTTSRQEAAAALDLCGDRAGAERELETSWRVLAAHRSDGKPQSAAMAHLSRLALLYCDEGRWEEAERCLEYGQEAPAQGGLRLAARARVAAHRGDLSEALSLARRGVELAGECDGLDGQAMHWLAFAEVLRANGEEAEADTATEAAVRIWEQKGNLAAAARVRAAESARSA